MISNCTNSRRVSQYSIWGLYSHHRLKRSRFCQEEGQKYAYLLAELDFWAYFKGLPLRGL